MHQSPSTPYFQTSVVGAALLISTFGAPAHATTFSGEPNFTEVSRYSTIIDGDPTDIYFPVVGNSTASIPVALMLQGALVDKADYSNYARIVASYGFAVVVPNHERTLFGPTGPVTGLFPEQGQIQEVLDFIALENQTPTSPLNNLLDTNALGLLGHSFGGAVGIASIQDACFPILCTDGYSVPEALKAGIFYGTSFSFGPGVAIPPVNNEVPTGYILGSLDGVAAPALTLETYQKTLNPPKVLIEVEGTNHYGITDQDSFRDPSRPTLDQSVATETIGRWSGLFLRAHVLNDQDAFDFVYRFGDNLDSQVTVRSVQTPEPSAVTGGLMAAMALAGWQMLKRKPSP